MTEADWLTGTDLTAHVQFAESRLSPRRQRLLASGFCRAVLHFFENPDLIQALAVIERFADGRADVAEIERERRQCRRVAQEAYDAYARQVDGGESDATRSVWHELAWAVAYAATTPLPLIGVCSRAENAAVQAQIESIEIVPTSSPEWDAVRREQVAVMRSVVWEIVGNPFRALSFSSTWRTDTVTALARQIYNSREFSAMPILADALQDAGCDNDEILTHCRDTSAKHLRGCWVVDLVLGKP